MASSPDYIVYRPDAGAGISAQRGVRPASDKVFPMTPGLWQQETLETLQMYKADEGKFSPVAGKQLTLFPMDEAQAPAPVQKASSNPEPEQLIPHWANFKFFSEDTLRLARKIKDLYLVSPPGRVAELAPVVDRPLYDPATTELKSDQFPDRIRYTEGGLYEKPDPKMHANAPNYRKMKDKPVHGLGQPTRAGFEDVIKKMKGKPVVWANMRAEGIVYLEGKPFNLRQLNGMENVDLKKGATAAEVEAMEERLKKELLARGSVSVSEEVPVLGPDGKAVKEHGRVKTQRVMREIQLTPENCQTTREVVEELQARYPNFEYRRIPLSDEKSPEPASVDGLRQFMNEMSSRYEGKDPQFVFNCHQGKGRTTTSMVTAGITLDGKSPRQLELPFGEAERRAERNIIDNAHMQNLKTTVDEYRQKSDLAGKTADQFSREASRESDPDRKEQLELQAQRARAEQAKYADNAQEFTKRYALMQKYSEYVSDEGTNGKVTFDQWMKTGSHQADLQDKWASLNKLVGLVTPWLQPGSPSVAFA